MVRNLEALLYEAQTEDKTDDSEAAVTGMLFVLCTSLIIFTGVLLMLHTSP